MTNDNEKPDPSAIDTETAPAPLYTAADVQSAHEKQMKKFMGQGGIRFTPAEQHVLDNDIKPEKPVAIDV